MTDITPYLNRLDILNGTAKQVIKDFGMVGFEIKSSPTSVVRALLVNYPVDTALHKVYWDGRNSSGQIYSGAYTLWTLPNTPINLPSNPIILTNKSLDVTDIKAEPYLIVPVYNEVTTLFYTLSRLAKITLTINDPNGSHFRTLLNNQLQNQGPQEVVWDGKNDDGELVTVQGSYTATLTIADPDNPSVYVTRNAAIYVYK